MTGTVPFLETMCPVLEYETIDEFWNAVKNVLVCENSPFDVTYYVAWSIGEKTPNKPVYWLCILEM